MAGARGAPVWGERSICCARVADPLPRSFSLLLLPLLPLLLDPGLLPDSHPIPGRVGTCSIMILFRANYLYTYEKYLREFEVLSGRRRRRTSKNEITLTLRRLGPVAIFLQSGHPAAGLQSILKRPRHLEKYDRSTSSRRHTIQYYNVIPTYMYSLLDPPVSPLSHQSHVHHCLRFPLTPSFRHSLLSCIDGKGAALSLRFFNKRAGALYLLPPPPHPHPPLSPPTW